MKKTVKTLLIILFAALFTVSAVNVVFALSTADAKEPIDTSKKCSLTLTYAIDGKKLEGLEIEIYQTATVTADFQYSMTGTFAAYPIEINGIKSQSEWDEVKDTVTAYIAADKIAPTDTQSTDKNGVVKFENLPVGIYYVRWTQNETVDQVQGFAPFMIAVPGLGDDGKWIYDVNALPKPGMMPEPEVGEMRLVKLWKDGSQSDKRPQAILVEIFRNGQSYETVELTAEKNWTYTWETDGTYTWTAVERNIPEGYTVSIQSRDGNTIQITNTLANDPNPPQTGDSFNMVLWIMLMALSGIVLIVLSGRRRKVYEE